MSINAQNKVEFTLDKSCTYVRPNSKTNSYVKSLRRILQFISWRICVESFINLIFSVGTKGQNELFDSLNANIDSIASKFVTFAIKTFYVKIDLKELEQLFEEVKDNYLAQCILREYIKRHLNTNFIELKKRDQIIQIAGFNKQRLMGKMKTI